MTQLEDESIREAIAQLRLRAVPHGARARVLESIQSDCTPRRVTGLQLRRAAPVFALAVFSAGAAIASLSMHHRPVFLTHSSVERAPSTPPATSSVSAKPPLRATPPTDTGATPEVEAEAPSSIAAVSTRAVDKPNSSGRGTGAEASPPRKLNRQAQTDRSASSSRPASVRQHAHGSDSSTHAPAKDTALAKQIRSYRAAISTNDPSARVARLRSFKARYPGSALVHEADLNIVKSLGESRKAEEQKAAARAFLKDHPQSARAADIERLAEPKDLPVPPSTRGKQ